MKILRLERITIISQKEKKGKSIKFDPKLTILKGKNKTGKSSIIKSILFAFGAEPNKISRRWKEARVKILVEFKVDNSHWAIIRDGLSIHLYQNSEFKGTYKNTISDWSPAFNSLVDSKLHLSNKNGEIIPAIPACLFMPYYLDQETGWMNKWTSFRNMGIYPEWQKLLFNYHSGILSDKWFDIKASEFLHKKNREIHQKRKDMLTTAKGVISPIAERLKFSINDKVFADDLNEVLAYSDQMTVSQSKFKKRLSMFRNERAVIVGQIEILSKAQIELSKDLDFSESNPDAIECPTCGSIHANDYSARFSIINDEENCATIIFDLEEKLTRIDESIAAIHNKFEESHAIQIKLMEILQRKRDKLTVHEVIKKTGQDAALESINASIAKCQIELDAANKNLKLIREEMKIINDKEKRKEVLEHFVANCESLISELNLGKVKLDELINVKQQINENGAELPRSILAFQLAFLRTIAASQGKTQFPLIIDAPNQQEQDPENLESILASINSRLPSGTQTILGLVDNANVEMKGTTYVFTEQYSILSELEYEECKQTFKIYDKISPYA
jgi:DNA repair exonuclease SbcCD ATPase subunit